MSYTTFRSPAIVIAHRPHGESDRVVTLLTQEHGVIDVRVQSARKYTSRLRYGTQFLTRGTFEYIQARHTWRLVGVHDVINVDLPTDHVQLLAPLCRDITYFVQGEDTCSEIYQTCFQILESTDMNNFSDYVLQKRIEVLHYFGYIDLDGDDLDTIETLPPGVIKKYHQMILNAYQVSQM